MSVRSCPVYVEIEGVHYSGWYDVSQGGRVAVYTKQFGQASGYGMPAEIVAATLLREMVNASPL